MQGSASTRVKAMSALWGQVYLFALSTAFKTVLKTVLIEACSDTKFDWPPEETLSTLANTEPILMTKTDHNLF